MTHLLRVYTISGVKDAELCRGISAEDNRTLRGTIIGVPRCRSWSPVPVEIIHGERGRRFLASDSPWWTTMALILRPKAVAELRSILEEYGELLPLVCDEDELVLFNVTRVIDALDEAASEVSRFPDGRLCRIEKYAFRSEIVGSACIFKIPNRGASPVFVTQEFVDRWNAAGLRGIEFVLRWGSSIK